MLDVSGQLKFEQCAIYPTLFVIVEKDNRERVVGYVNFHPFASGWFWFNGGHAGPFFQTKEEATEHLVHEYLTTRMDKMSNKLGILHDERYTNKNS